jgi:periplasmic copper chaperone A
MNAAGRVALALGLVLATSAPALAHVEVEAASNAQAAKLGEVVITVPNESAGADTTSVVVRLPDNVLQAEFPEVAGWRSTAETVPLTPPVQIGDQTIATRISTVTWTGGRIRPGRSAQFRVRVRVREGSKLRGLAFPAVQRFSDGTVVRWIGAPGSENPAGVLLTALPVVRVTSPATPSTPTPVPSGTTTSSSPPTSSRASPDGGGTSGLAIGLIVAACVVVLGGGAFALSRLRKKDR